MTVDLADLPPLRRNSSASFLSSPIKNVHHLEHWSPECRNAQGNEPTATQNGASPQKSACSASPQKSGCSASSSPVKLIDLPAMMCSGLATPPNCASPMRSGRHLDYFSPLWPLDSPAGVSSGLPTPQSTLSPTKNRLGGMSTPGKRTRAGSLAGLGFSPCEDHFPESPSKRQLDMLIEGIRCISSSSDARVVDVNCQTPPHTIAKLAKPIPKQDVDWLMGTLTSNDLANFHRRFFFSDCQRRFQELGADATGLLGFEHLKDALPEMFPTLKLDLKADGHHIPALDKSIPSLIATFDSDSDGYLDFDDFVRLIKFQRAWRAQFFSTSAPGARQEQAEKGTKTAPANLAKLGRGFSKSAPLPQLGMSLGSKKTRKDAWKIAEIDANERPSSSASISTRCSSSQSTRSSLDSTRGAFYSTLMGFS